MENVNRLVTLKEIVKVVNKQTKPHSPKDSTFRQFYGWVLLNIQRTSHFQTAWIGRANLKSFSNCFMKLA